mmetsp:Transcript_132985/g.370721  ORF Transcript_132985/g.370721 Transcript_132985/m.370721 type:complete len:267 (-) Transcript_132985:700-1500(-)
MATRNTCQGRSGARFCAKSLKGVVSAKSLPRASPTRLLASISSRPLSTSVNWLANSAKSVSLVWCSTSDWSRPALNSGSSFTLIRALWYWLWRLWSCRCVFSDTWFQTVASNQRWKPLSMRMHCWSMDSGVAHPWPPAPALVLTPTPLRRRRHAVMLAPPRFRSSISCRRQCWPISSFLGGANTQRAFEKDVGTFHDAGHHCLVGRSFMSACRSMSGQARSSMRSAIMKCPKNARITTTQVIVTRKGEYQLWNSSVVPATARYGAR